MECLCCFNLFPSGNMTSNDRVKLQFGFWQNIPNPPHNLDKFHQTDMRGHLPNRASCTPYKVHTCQDGFTVCTTTHTTSKRKCQDASLHLNPRNEFHSNLSKILQQIWWRKNNQHQITLYSHDERGEWLSEQTNEESQLDLT